MNTKYPELNDYIQDCFFEDKNMFEACKNIIEIINEYSREAGVNKYDIWEYLTDALTKIEELDTEEKETKDFNFLSQLK